MPHLPPITQALLLLNFGVFCLQYLFGAWMHDPFFERLFSLWPLGHGFWPWQIVSYAFLHADTMHLLFNSLGLWTFGAELEMLWGRKRFLHFYLASVLAAGASQLLLCALIQSPHPTMGASGGLFGFLLAFGMIFPERTITPLLPPIPMKAKYFVAIFGGIELLLGVLSPSGGVAHFAHLGGMLGGFLMLRYWRGQPPFGRR
jgi:membrane associated rhomboid family serine protease